MTLTPFRQFPLRRAAALALVTVLASCGGFTAVSIGGTVTGLTGTGLTIANGGKTLAIAPGATTFTFPDQVDIRSTYAVSVVTQPFRQSCDIFNAAGTAGAAPVTIINVACAANVFPVGGTITGLTGTGLRLNNGSDQLTVVAGATTFTMPTRVADGAVFGVTVLSQPAGQTCTVAGGTGVLDSTATSGTGVLVNNAISSIKVTCQ